MIGADAIAEIVLRVAKRVVTADDRRRDEVFRALELAARQSYLDTTSVTLFDRAREMLQFIDDEEGSLKERRRAVRKARGLPEDEDDRPRSFEDER